MTEEQKIDGYLEISGKINRMANLVDRFELSYFQDKMKENILSPLLDDGFQQDDIELFMRIAIHTALSDEKITNDQ